VLIGEPFNVLLLTANALHWALPAHCKTPSTSTLSRLAKAGRCT
jgi:hypothetical protein